MDAKLKLSPHEAFARPHAALVAEELARCQRPRYKNGANVFHARAISVASEF